MRYGDAGETAFSNRTGNLGDGRYLSARSLTERYTPIVPPGFVAASRVISSRAVITGYQAENRRRGDKESRALCGGPPNSSTPGPTAGWSGARVRIMAWPESESLALVMGNGGWFFSSAAKRQGELHTLMLLLTSGCDACSVLRLIGDGACNTTASWCLPTCQCYCILSHQLWASHHGVYHVEQ